MNHTILASIMSLGLGMAGAAQAAWLKPYIYQCVLKKTRTQSCIIIKKGQECPVYEESVYLYRYLGRTEAEALAKHKQNISIEGALTCLTWTNGNHPPYYPCTLAVDAAKNPVPCDEERLGTIAVTK